MTDDHIHRGESGALRIAQLTHPCSLNHHQPYLCHVCCWTHFIITDHMSISYAHICISISSLEGEGSRLLRWTDASVNRVLRRLDDVWLCVKEQNMSHLRCKTGTGAQTQRKMGPASRKSKLNCPHLSFCCKEEVCCKQRTWNRDRAGHTIGLIQQTNGGTRQPHQSSGRQSAFPDVLRERNLLLHSGTTGKRQQHARNDDASARTSDQRSVYTQKLLHRKAFKQKRLYTQELLHTEAITQKSFNTEREDAYTQTFSNRLRTHTHKRSCTEQPLHRSLYTVLTQRSRYTHRNLYTENAVYA